MYKNTQNWYLSSLHNVLYMFTFYLNLFLVARFIHLLNGSLIICGNICVILNTSETR